MRKAIVEPFVEVLRRALLDADESNVEVSALRQYFEFPADGGLVRCVPGDTFTMTLRLAGVSDRLVKGAAEAFGPTGRRLVRQSGRGSKGKGRARRAHGG